VCEAYQAALDSSRQAERKISHASSLSQDEIKELISLLALSLPLSHQLSMARSRLKKILSASQREMKLHKYIAENLLYLIWRHLQFYLVHCKPVGGARGGVVGGVTFTKSAMRQPSKDTTFDLSSMGEGVSAGDLETLKTSIGRCLPSSLYTQLLALEDDQTASIGHVSFVQSLVHRIKRLVKLKAAVTVKWGRGCSTSRDSCWLSSLATAPDSDGRKW
jgi:nuclear pore complex protein Nup205